MENQTCHQRCGSFSNTLLDNTAAHTGSAPTSINPAKVRRIMDGTVEDRKVAETVVAMTTATAAAASSRHLSSTPKGMESKEPNTVTQTNGKTDEDQAATGAADHPLQGSGDSLQKPLDLPVRSAREGGSEACSSGLDINSQQ